ncbi:DUF6233 domain-containing protein [Streptomyces fagopyri]
MNDLPPDPQRLRAILAHLDQQLATQATVATYLRLQRDSVRRALAAAERPAPRPQRGRPKGEVPARVPVQLAELGVEEQRADGRVTGAMVHTASCMPRMQLRPIARDVARQALVNDPQFMTACPLCQPDRELGLDVA